jgi:predicted  nucleic acid-binding Zn ribbon protein
LFKKYAHKAEEAVKETAEKSDISDEDEKVQQAGRDLKAFIEKVSNKKLDGVIKASQKVSIF